MMFLLTLGIAALVLILFTFLSCRALFKRGWFLIWLRSSLAMSALAGSGVMVLGAYDLLSFYEFDSEEVIAEVSIAQKSYQEYSLTLTMSESGKASQSYLIKGDMWQIDLKLLYWNGLPEWLGKSASYRLDRVSGRYQKVQDELAKERTVYEINNTGEIFDAWSVVAQNPWIPGLRAKQGAGAFVPMADGASFEVKLGSRGLIIYPSNDVAKNLLNRWE